MHWTFAPCVAVPQDDRWGRTYEGFGETAGAGRRRSATAAVRGLQGADIAESRPRAGEREALRRRRRHHATVSIAAIRSVDEATLRTIHLPGYVAAIKAGVGTIMVSYSSWNGEKMHGNRRLLTDMLKGELGFEGFVVSDWNGIDQLPGDTADRTRSRRRSTPAWT